MCRTHTRVFLNCNQYAAILLHKQHGGTTHSCSCSPISQKPVAVHHHHPHSKHLHPHSWTQTQQEYMLLIKNADVLLTSIAPASLCSLHSLTSPHPYPPTTQVKALTSHTQPWTGQHPEHTGPRQGIAAQARAKLAALKTERCGETTLQPTRWAQITASHPKVS